MTTTTNTTTNTTATATATATKTGYQLLPTGHAPIKAWTQGVPFEAEAEAQLRRVAALPFIHQWIAVMPDVHAGIGATVGSVIASARAVIPAAVGVDIGCGMMAVKTSLRAEQLPDDLRPLRLAIEAAVPHGRTDRGGKNDRGAYGEPPARTVDAWAELQPGYEQILAKHESAGSAMRVNQLGTLGTGNHFIELCLDEAGAVWVMLHSGSRGVGNRIGSYFIDRAKAEMRRWFINLPDADLAYLPEGSELFDDYVHAVEWAQRYARMNRELMMHATIDALRATGLLPEFTAHLEAVNCHHNYISREHHYGANVIVTRKGAVRARQGELGIIPGSMGAKSFIVRGKGNAESFTSCSHGAGRAMSRNKAKKVFSLADHAAATAGVECRKDEDVIDETPGAYKAIDDVMAAQADLVEIVYTLKQVVCVKG
ncbi:MAG TPA: RtcB family protein [Kofleriaceae bacterium]|nr:RtcB family protein [Kofleriaceae bacterium]